MLPNNSQIKTTPYGMNLYYSNHPTTNYEFGTFENSKSTYCKLS